MSPITLSCVVFLGVFGAALLAMLAGRMLPGHHLSGESKDAVKQGLALIGTLTALVLGLLIATAKGTYDTQSSTVTQMSTNVLLLDRVLGKFGPQTKEAREQLRGLVTAMREGIWPENGSGSARLTPGEARAEGDLFYDMVADLTPKTDAQAKLRQRALDLAADLAQMRLRLYVQRESSIPVPFLVVLVFWLVILFAGIGLLAPRNATVVAVLFVCTLSVSGALFLILELDRPFEGIMRVSSRPLQDALSLLGK
jgi:hypothetical protein